MSTKNRSPRYPTVGLKEALDRIKLVYQKEYRHQADKEVVAKDLGYAGLNGASLGMIAALKHYGLLKVAGEGLRVSDDATTIIELPSGDPERVEAIKRVAFSPKLFAELYENYGFKLPSDESLKLSLIRKGFNNKAATSLVRTFRDIISLVQEETGDYNGGASESSGSQEAVKQVRPITSRSSEPQRSSSSSIMEFTAPDIGSFTEALLYRISDDCKVRVFFNGAVTREAIKKLIAYLELGMDDFPSRSQLEQPSDAQKLLSGGEID